MGGAKKRASEEPAREMKTVRAMIEIFCRGRHGARAGLCGPCERLWNYAQDRVERCPFGADKPVCRKCPVHCYRPARREEIREVMRYAGPRMLRRHPILTLAHRFAGRKPAPAFPGRKGGNS